MNCRQSAACAAAAGRYLAARTRTTLPASALRSTDVLNCTQTPNLLPREQNRARCSWRFSTRITRRFLAFGHQTLRRAEIAAGDHPDSRKLRKRKLKYADAPNGLCLRDHRGRRRWQRASASQNAREKTSENVDYQTDAPENFISRLVA